MAYWLLLDEINIDTNLVTYYDINLPNNPFTNIDLNDIDGRFKFNTVVTKCSISVSSESIEDLGSLFLSARIVDRLGCQLSQTRRISIPREFLNDTYQRIITFDVFKYFGGEDLQLRIKLHYRKYYLTDISMVNLSVKLFLLKD